LKLPEWVSRISLTIFGSEHARVDGNLEPGLSSENWQNNVLRSSLFVPSRTITLPIPSMAKYFSTKNSGKFVAARFGFKIILTTPRDTRLPKLLGGELSAEQSAAQKLKTTNHGHV